MAVSARQAELFAGESWQVIYQAFTQINFNATDPVSINTALRAYIEANYPEVFNDWIVSSEFVAILDLLSWLAGTLAYKTDLAARENFIDTAEARESILRLARFLSYNPSRCQSAAGILKIVSVATDDDVFDSFGVNQANNTILWNDPNNQNWFEQFTAVLNNAFVSTNPFGIPLKSGTVSGVATQLYRVNGFTANTSFNFSENVGGTGMDFEVCNADFTDLGNLFERDPNPVNAFHLYYFNDSNGNNSTRTGFFLLFKQGSTQKQVFNITVPVENQILDINSTNVNQNDIWVQSIDDSGAVNNNWTKVIPAVLNSNVNITFNNIPTTQRNIFAVLTRDNDQISIRFSDGRFGNAPVGMVQVIYRVANGLNYQIRPLEIDNITLPITFINRMGVSKSLNLTFSLFESVANASSTETIEQIRQRAPQVYATQNRMVSGEDYNSFPLAFNIAAKIKAVNRVYSGQSRYIDLHDPSGTYQDLSLFADDGILYLDPRSIYLEVPSLLVISSDDIINNYLRPAIDNHTTIAFINDVLIQNVLLGKIVPTSNTWTKSSADLFQTTGWFSAVDNLIQPGAFINFRIGQQAVWVAVIEVPKGGNIATIPAINTAGPVTLAREVPTGSLVQAIIPSASVQLDASALAIITDKIKHNLSFSLWYDYSNSNSINGPTWQVRDPQNDFGGPEPAILHGTELLVMYVNRTDRIWRINTRGLRLVIESIGEIQWFDDGNRTLTQLTGEASRDMLRVMRINHNLNDPAGYALDKDYDFAIDRLWLYPDGTPEPRRSTVLYNDSDEDGYSDEPDAYYKVTSFGFSFPLAVQAVREETRLALVSATDLRGSLKVGQVVRGYGIAMGTTITAMTSNTITLGTPISAALAAGSTITISDPVGRNTYLFWSNASNPPYDQPCYSVVAYDTETLRMANTPSIGTIGFQDHARSNADVETFWVYTSTGWQQDVNGTYHMRRGRGPNVAAKWITDSGIVVPSGDSLKLHWKHFAPSDQRIDPSSTNIHDLFVLTYSYDAQVRQWITNGAVVANRPKPPTELDLRLQFSKLEPFKMFSDQIVWRPVRYKYLFGNGAEPELQAQFKVIRVPNATASDGEIKSRIRAAIETYFNVANWDFGETFWFTELAAYIHQQLAGLIGSVVIVPKADNAAFGDGFEVTCRSDEIFVSTTQVSDIIIIPSNTAVNLRIHA